MPEERWSVGGEDAYAVLGVRWDADDDQIAAAFRALARRHHPDVAGDDATGLMSRINAAWDVLRDPDRREAYDRELDAADVAAGRPGHRVTAGRVRRAQRRAGRASAGAPPPSGSGAGPTRPLHGRAAERDGTGGAGPAPGRPSGSVLRFGRHIGWSLGEIARVDPGYLEWLEGRREGRPYLDEIDELLVRIGCRSTPRRPRNTRATSARRSLLGRR